MKVRQAIQHGTHHHPAAGPGYGHGVANAQGALPAAEQSHRIPLATIPRQAQFSVDHDRSRELIGIASLLVVAVLVARVAVTGDPRSL